MLNFMILREFYRKTRKGKEEIRSAYKALKRELLIYLL